MRWNALTEIGHALWSSAFHLMRTLLEGVLSHQGAVIQRADVEEGVPRFRVVLSHELMGEFATRSRMGATIRLQEEICFTVKLPKDFFKEPVSLEITGLDFPALPGAVSLRAEMVRTLGDNFNRAKAFELWEQEKEKFPLEVSKLRRVHESLAQYYLPQYVAEKAFWGYLNALPSGSSLIGQLDFYQEDEEVRLTARRGPSHDAQLEAQLALVDQLCVEVLREDRLMGERFAPSSMNFLAMTHGRLAGQKGADPKKIAKLFSAAENWGPGDSGWTQFDPTWTCTDEKDWMGRTIKEQGRVIWHDPGFKLT